MARLGSSQRLLATSPETSWGAAFRWICETPGSFLQAWSSVSILRAALPRGGGDMESLPTSTKQTFAARMPVYRLVM